MEKRVLFLRLNIFTVLRWEATLNDPVAKVFGTFEAGVSVCMELNGKWVKGGEEREMWATPEMSL